MKNIKDLKIIYMGTPSFSAKLLDYLIQQKYIIIGVVTKEDAPVGRKRIMSATPVKELALKHNIPIFTPHRIRLDHNFIVDAKPDLILTFAYGQIVPLAVLEAPTYGCLNFHGSILPYYRGASPIQMALMNNETETGVSLMEMVEKMDAGRVYGIERFALEEDDNFETVSLKMVSASIKLIREVLPDIVSGKNKGIEQDESKVTFAPLLKANDETIDFTQDGTRFVCGKIRAFSPEIGVSVGYYDMTLKLFKARFVSNEMKYDFGTLFYEKNRLFLQLLDGIIEILLLQKSGKKLTDAANFINGEKNKLPTTLRGI